MSISIADVEVEILPRDTKGFSVLLFTTAEQNN